MFAAAMGDARVAHGSDITSVLSNSLQDSSHQ